MPLQFSRSVDKDKPHICCLQKESVWAGLTAVNHWKQTDPFARKNIYSAIKYDQEGSPHSWVQSRNGWENATTESWVCPARGDLDLTAVLPPCHNRPQHLSWSTAASLRGLWVHCNSSAGERKECLGIMFVTIKILMEGKNERRGFSLLLFKKPEWRVRCC